MSDTRLHAPAHASLAASPPAVYVCDRCGAPMVEQKCKIICENCGLMRDCSDP